MRFPLIALIAGLACTSAPALAQECAPLRRAFSLELFPTGPRFAVPVTVNGQMKRFMLDTAEFSSRISRDIVTELKLTPRNEGHMLSFGGTIANAELVTVDLLIGPVKARQEMFVMEDSGPYDGLFGPNLMRNYDIEFDFAGRKLSYFLTDHCEGRVVHWTRAPFTTVPFKGWTSGSAQALTIPVIIDGKELQAEIDTSLPQTIMDAATASAVFGLTPDSPGVARVGASPTSPAGRAFAWTFKVLKIGALTISDPRMRVEADIIGTRTRDTLQADSRVLRRTDNFLPSMRLGLDVLRQLHIYLAVTENKLYITPN